ncbi:death domain-containing protein CRADD-like [Babylonia areolata]|uniref:death domain-containing protein CRADD-like n=1 Tax=Babylonia areolata TaxID=304850 RepID=UPI003FD2C76B
MPVKKGRLKPEERYRIQKNYDFLKDNFDPVNGALDHLISDLVFDLSDNDFVTNGGEKTARGRVERFISVLENSGPDSYPCFIKALNSTGDQHIARQLEETHVPEDNKKDPLAWIDELPESVKQERPSDADASRLSTAFGAGWKHVFLELEVSQAKIDQALMNSPHSVSTAISSLISRWRQRNGSRAQFIVLLNAMKEASNRCIIDWDSIQTVVKGKLESTR